MFGCTCEAVGSHNRKKPGFSPFLAVAHFVASLRLLSLSQGHAAGNVMQSSTIRKNFCL